MIETYEIKNINGNEVLYLYFSIDSEFSNFKTKQRLEDVIKSFIKQNKIVFKGTIVSLVVGGTIIGNIVLNKSKTLKPIYNNPKIVEKIDFNELTNIDKNIEQKESKEEMNNIIFFGKNRNRK